MVSGGYNDNHPGTHWLYGMYVTPAARGSGAAELLVGAVANWAPATARARSTFTSPPASLGRGPFI